MRGEHPQWNTRRFVISTNGYKHHYRPYSGIYLYGYLARACSKIKYFRTYFCLTSLGCHYPANQADFHNACFRIDFNNCESLHTSSSLARYLLISLPAFLLLL